MTYSPNLPINSGWKSTVQNAFQVLRRIKFMVEHDFEWTDFDPKLNFGTMTATAVQVYDMRGRRVGNTFEFYGTVGATLAAVFATDVTVTIPYTIASRPTSIIFGESIPVMNAGAWESGWWYGLPNTNLVNIRRFPVAAYTAGAFMTCLSGTVEVA